MKVSFGRILLYIVGFGMAIFWLVPILWMIITAFKPEGSPVTVLSELFKPPFTLANFQYVSSHASILLWTWNSLFIAVVTTVVTVLIDSLAAFALSRLHFKGKKLMFGLVIAGLMIPAEGMIVPLFMMMANSNMINSYTSIILPGLAGPLGVMILKQFYDGLPNELMDSAKIDGANLFRIWWNICVPLSKSAMAALSIFTFITSWNNFLWPFLDITTDQMMTLPVGIPVFQNALTGELCVPMAANLLASIPAIIVFILFQKHIIKGITMTGIKG